MIPDRAIAAAERALAMRDTLPEHFQHLVPESLELKADAVYLGGDLLSAIAIKRQALAEQAALDDRGIAYARILSGLGLLAGASGDLPEGIELVRESLAIKRGLEARGPGIASSAIMLAELLRRTGELEEAEALQREGLDIRVECYGERHATVAKARYGLGVILLAKRDVSGAERVLRDALEVAAAVLPADHLDLLQLRNRLGYVLTRNRKPAEAVPQFEVVLAHVEVDNPWMRGIARDARLELGLARTLLGELDAAEDVLLEEWAVVEAGGAADPSRRRRVATVLVELYERWQRGADAARFRARMSAPSK